MEGGVEPPHSRESIMFSDTKFWRLIWKEYRTQRPLWLALLVGTQVLQIAFLALNWALNGSPPLQPTDPIRLGLLGIAYGGSAIYVLGCCATLFSVEHETGTFDFQRVLPANQPRVFWAKVGFALVSSMGLTLLLWIITRGVFVLTLPREGTVYGGFGLLFLVELFCWSILCSLLIQQPLWGVVTAITLQSVMLYFVVPYLRGPMQDSDWPGSSAGFVPTRIGVVLALLAGNIVVGKLWFEDRLRLPRWRSRRKPDIAPSYPSDAELPPYIGERQFGWSRSLWLGWRDGRWVQGAILVWFGFEFFTLKTANRWTDLLLPGLTGSFVCGLFAFAPEHWSSRFRFMAERGCPPRLAWVSRQAIWLPPVLVMSVATLWLQTDNYGLQYPPHLRPEDAAFGRMMPALGPFLCYSAGQFAAMLIRSTVVAIAVGVALAVFAFMWGQLMTSWLAPAWWSVGSLPVIGLFVTWLKANDWVEERHDRVARWRLALGIGVPVVVLLATCATYRVIQIPVVMLPPEWDEAPQILARLTPAEKETLRIYRRAVAEIEGGEDRLETYEARRTRLQKEHADWTDRQVRVEAFDGFYRDWLAQHVAVLPLLREAHGKPPVPLALVEADLPPRPNDDSIADRTEKLPWLMIQQAEHSRITGDLDATWNDILIAFELLRRSDLRAAPVRDLFTNTSSSFVHEAWFLATVAKWGRHNEQSRDRIIMAIRKLEEIAPDRTLIQSAVHHEYLQALEWLKLGETWKRYAQAVRSWGEGETFWKLSTVWNAMFWERWRSDRVVRWQSSLALQRADLLGRILKANRRLPLFSQSQFPSVQDLADIAELMPPEERTKLDALNNYDRNSAEGAILQATLVPPNMHWGVFVIVETEFLKRAESFRATMLLLALADFHREHGRYPESLTELAPTYFAEVPRDPKMAVPFVYFPHGVPDDVTDGSEDDRNFRTIVNKDVPFLVTFGAGTWRRSQLHDGSWEFTNDDGKRVDLSSALRFARVWVIENDDAKSDL